VSFQEKKIYADDRDVPFKTTKISPINTRSDIDAILARWGIKKTGWNFDPDNNQVEVQFQLPFEKFGGADISPVVRLSSPRIWNRKKRNSSEPESVNWRVSLRILHWFIKNTLAMAYAMQSQKAVAFLPYIETGKNQLLKDLISGNFKNLHALEQKAEPVNVTEEDL
jgi:hypothetical protein